MTDESNEQGKASDRAQQVETVSARTNAPHFSLARCVRKNWFLLVLLVVALFGNYFVTNPMRSLPTMLYGGDYYYQLGQTYHVASGGNALESATLRGALPGYFVLYSALVGYPARWFGIDALQAEFLFSYFILFACIILVYWLCYRVFGSSLLAALGVLLYIQPGNIVVKYTDFAHYVMIPLLLVMTYVFLSKNRDCAPQGLMCWRSLWPSVILGVVYGLIGLTHSIAFIGASFFLAAVFLWYCLLPAIRQKEGCSFTQRLLHPAFLRALVPYCIVAGIGILIALLWWYAPLFVYHGKTAAHYSEWNYQNYDPLSYQLRFLRETIAKYFFDFSSFYFGLLTVLRWLGIVGLVFLRPQNDKTASEKTAADQGVFFARAYVKFAFVTSLIIVFHYFVTQNLFHTNFIPGYLGYLLLAPVLVLLGIVGVQTLVALPVVKSKAKTVLWVVLLLVIIGQYVEYETTANGPWYAQNARQSLPEPYVSLQKYLLANTQVSDVILTTKELGFAVNALSGRKLLVVRRAQNDPFFDTDSRELDAGIILYGNNTAQAVQLLKQHHISYLYWDAYWQNSEYSIGTDGKVTGWFDPLIAFYSVEKEEALKNAGVSYVVQDTWADPALRGPDYKTFKLLFVSPQNYFNSTHPWKPELDQFMTEVWRYNDRGQTVARLFKINI